MKMLVILCFSLLFCLGEKYKIAAQSYIPFPDSNAYWLLLSPTGSGAELFATDSVKNDTMINSMNYTKLFSCYGIPLPTIYDYIGAYRNDTTDKKTFYVPKDSTQEYLLYDFSANTGDTIRKVITRHATMPVLPIQYEIIDFRVDSITYQVIGPINHKKMYLSNLSYVSYDTEWIEKIGSYGGVIDYYTGMGLLQCMSHNDTIYYDGYNGFSYINGRCDTVNLQLGIDAFSSNNNIEIYPSPVTNYLSIDFASIVSYPIQINIYNSIGDICKTFLLNQPTIRIDISEFPNGIYFLQITGDNNLYQSHKIIKQ